MASKNPYPHKRNWIPCAHPSCDKQASQVFYGDKGEPDTHWCGSHVPVAHYEWPKDEDPDQVEEAVSSKPCPSCSPSTKHECDTCGGTGLSPEQRCWSCGTIKVKGRCPVSAKDCGRNNARRKYDLRKESSTSALIDALFEESTDDVVAAFRSSMAERMQRKLAERVSLEELYLDSSEHPEVKELIRRGFRLKKSRGDRDVLEGPGGERRVIRRKNGKVHVVREGVGQPGHTTGNVPVGVCGCEHSKCSNPDHKDSHKNGCDADVYDEDQQVQHIGRVCAGCASQYKEYFKESKTIPCDHCDENGYSQKYKATCRVCKGTKLRSEFRMPEDFARVEDETRALVLQQMKARGEDRINFAPLRDRKGPSPRRRLFIKSNKGIKEDVSGLAEGTHQTIWDESGEQVGYYGPAGEPSEQGEFIWGHTQSGVVGHSRSLEAAKERLKQTHFAHVGKEVPLREETVNEVSDKTMKSYVNKAIDSHADHVLWTRERRQLASKSHQKGDLASSEYHDEEGDKEDHRADKRKEGILRAMRKLTKEEQELFEDPFLTPAKLHKYISFGREDLFNAERSKRDDLGRANRHEDEAANAKTDDDRNFHNDRAKAFSKSAAMTDKAIALRKKGLSTAAKRLLKTGGAPK